MYKNCLNGRPIKRFKPGVRPATPGPPCLNLLGGLARWAGSLRGLGVLGGLFLSLAGGLCVLGVLGG